MLATDQKANAPVGSSRELLIALLALTAFGATTGIIEALCRLHLLNVTRSATAMLFCGSLNPMFSNYVSQIDTEGTLASSYRTGTLQPLITAFCASAQASRTATSNEVATQRKAVEDATTAKAEAESALAAAQAAEDAALAAVREVCPAFDPTSV